VNLLVVLPLYSFGLPVEAPRAVVPRRPGRWALRSWLFRERHGRQTIAGAVTPPPSTALYRLLFSLVAVSMTLAAVIASMMSVHLLTVLEQRGVPLGTAVALGAIVGPCQVGARLIDLMAGQRVHPMWEAVLSGIFVVAGLALLLASHGALLPGLVLYGGGIGLRSIVRGTLPLALFGPAGYASLIGRLAFPMLIGQAAAPSVGAVLLVHFGGQGVLTALLWMAVATLIFSALLVPFANLRRAKFAG
jgi:hypothetical protein